MESKQLIQRAVETELAELLSQHEDRRTEKGNAGVVRNGYLPERELQTGLGPVTVQIPKVRAKTGDAVTFRSALVPPYIRKTKSMEAAVPWLYLKGVSSGEMGEALKVLVGPQAAGFVGEHGIAPEASLGRGVPPKLRGAAGCRPLGVCLGRRHLQRTAG